MKMKNDLMIENEYLPIIEKKSDFKIFLGMSHVGPLVPCWYYTMLSRN